MKGASGDCPQNPPRPNAGLRRPPLLQVAGAANYTRLIQLACILIALRRALDRGPCHPVLGAMMGRSRGRAGKLNHAHRLAGDVTWPQLPSDLPPGLQLELRHDGVCAAAQGARRGVAVPRRGRRQAGDGERPRRLGRRVPGCAGGGSCGARSTWEAYAAQFRGRPAAMRRQALLPDSRMSLGR